MRHYIEGDSVRSLVAVIGCDCDDHEHTLSAGAAGTITSIGPEGVHVEFECGALDAEGDPALIICVYDQREQSLFLRPLEWPLMSLAKSIDRNC